MVSLRQPFSAVLVLRLPRARIWSRWKYTELSIDTKVFGAKWFGAVCSSSSVLPARAVHATLIHARPAQRHGHLEAGYLGLRLGC